jgi:hypothetical protein
MFKVFVPLGLAVLLGGAVGRSFQAIGSDDQAVNAPAASADHCCVSDSVSCDGGSCVGESCGSRLAVATTAFGTTDALGGPVPLPGPHAAK